MFTQHFDVFLPTSVSFCIAAALLVCFHLECTLVSRETTIHLIKKGLYENTQQEGNTPGETVTVHDPTSMRRNILEFIKYGNFRVRYRDVCIQHDGGGMCQPTNKDYLRKQFLPSRLGGEADKQAQRTFDGSNSNSLRGRSTTDAINAIIGSEGDSDDNGKGGYDYMTGGADAFETNSDTEADILLGGPGWWKGNDKSANMVRLYDMALKADLLMGKFKQQRQQQLQQHSHDHDHGHSHGHSHEQCNHNHSGNNSRDRGVEAGLSATTSIGITSSDRV